MEQYWFIIAITLLQLGDIYTTMRVLSQPNTKEANPVVRWLMGKVGRMVFAS